LTSPTKTKTALACPGLYHIPQMGDGGLCRVRLEQGRLTPTQLHQLACFAQTYGNGTIELTSRANIQLRGIAPDRAQSLVLALEKAGLAPKMPAGDGVRNIMVNPTAGFDKQGDDRIIILAQELSECLQTNPRYQTLSPKFSIFLDGGESCAFINHIHDIWLSLYEGGRSFAFGLASRPPLVDEIGKPIPVILGKVPFWGAKRLIFTFIELLLASRDKNEKIERMKHWLAYQDPAMIFGALEQKLPFVKREKDFRRPRPKLDAHLGCHRAKQDGHFYLGIQSPLGVLTPEMAHFIADSAAFVEHLCLTPWQGIIFPNIPLAQAENLKILLKKVGFITDGNQALARIVCCAGAPGCRSAKSDVRMDALKLAERLEDKNFPFLHLTGCVKSCASNEARAITFVATAPGLYDIFMADGATAESFGRLLARSVTIKQAADRLSNF